MTLKKAIIIGIVLELLLCCAAGLFYFKFYIYTPTYSVRAIQKALQSGDIQELQRRADVDGIFKDCNDELLAVVQKNDPVYGKLEDGSFAEACKNDFFTYMRTGKWPDSKEITVSSSFQDKIGMKTVCMRSLEYINVDLPPDVEALREVSLTDKALEFGLSLVKKYIFGEGGDEDSTMEEVALEQEDDGLPKSVTAGVRVYEPNFGDSYILKLKLRRQEDKSWYLYDIENFGQYISDVIRQNDRDYAQYKERVHIILTVADEKLAEVNEAIPESDVNWIFEVRKIVDSSDKQLKELKVPVAGGYLHQLLNERDDLYHDFLDSCYELSEQKEKMEGAKQLSDEREKKNKKPTFNVNSWNNRLAQSSGKIAERKKLVADNKAKIEAIVGRSFDRDEFALTAARNMRNNDDAAVRAANYPGVSDMAPDPYSLTGGENLPVVSAYDNQSLQSGAAQ